MHILELYTGSFKHLFALGRIVIAHLGDYPDDSAVDNHHRAGAAGSHAAVKRGPFDGYAALGRLADRVLLGMDGAHAVLTYRAILMQHLAHLVPYFVAVWKAGRRSDIACSENLVVALDNTARAAPVTGCPLCDGSGHFHKVLVPGGAVIR